MISRDFFSVANNLGDSVAFNLESDTSAFLASPFGQAREKKTKKAQKAKPPETVP
jgi:hypothetical protein